MLFRSEGISRTPLREAFKILAAEACADTDAILDALANSCRSGDVVAILSNGGFDNIHERLLARLGQAD